MEDVTASPQVLTHHSEPSSDSYTIHTSSLTPDPMNRIPIDYHEFHEVFSGTKANTLPPHQPYDLQISLEEGAKPFHGLIYSLLPPELTALREFLEEHTQNGFICPTKSLWGSLVLFIKKRMGVSTYALISTHSTKSWRRIAICVTECALNFSWGQLQLSTLALPGAHLLFAFLLDKTWGVLVRSKSECALNKGVIKWWDHSEFPLCACSNLRLPLCILSKE